MITQDDYQLGSVIEYGSVLGDRRRVRVDEKEANIKNGRPGFSGELLNGDDEDRVDFVWGYDAQITRVVQF